MSEERPWSSTRLMAQPFVQAAAHRFDTAQAWIDEARAGGISYRRTDMLADWRREKDLMLYEVEMSRLSPTTTPREAALTETRWPGMSTRYMYEFRVVGEEIATKRTFSGYRAIATDRLLTVGEVMEDYLERLDAGTSDPDLEISQVTLMAVRFNPEK